MDGEAFAITTGSIEKVQRFVVKKMNLGVRLIDLSAIMGTLANSKCTMESSVIKSCIIRLLFGIRVHIKRVFAIAQR